MWRKLPRAKTESSQARTVLFREEEEQKRKDAETGAVAEEKPKEEDGAGRQDA